jgi:hypothetical protein
VVHFPSLVDWVDGTAIAERRCIAGEMRFLTPRQLTDESVGLRFDWTVNR